MGASSTVTGWLTETTATSGSIDKRTALLWDRGTGCCHPIAGTLDLKRGDKAATLVFGLPCGTVTMSARRLRFIAFYLSTPQPVNRSNTWSVR